MSQERKIIIGDVHGVISELDELLKLVDYKAPNTTLYSVGDFLDRGPDSTSVVRRMRELDVKAVMGNHERHFLRWYKGGNQFYEGKGCYKELAEHDELITYINNMPQYLQIDPQWMLFHAGLMPKTPIENQRVDDLFYRRFVDAENNKINIKKILNREIKKYKFWTDFGPFLGMNCVYGHTVHSKENIRIDRFDDGTACYGIDTGCVFGGRLSALILPTMEVVQVQAKQVYYVGHAPLPPSE